VPALDLRKLTSALSYRNSTGWSQTAANGDSPALPWLSTHSMHLVVNTGGVPKPRKKRAVFTQPLWPAKKMKIEDNLQICPSPVTVC